MINRFLVVIVCIVAACIATPSIQRSAADDKTPDNLATQLKQLQDQVTRLEARIAKLEKKPAYGTAPTAAPFGTAPYRMQPPEPGFDVWRRGVINGMTYYVVPMGTADAVGHTNSHYGFGDYEGGDMPAQPASAVANRTPPD
jgi:hypothetical protein